MGSGPCVFHSPDDSAPPDYSRRLNRPEAMELRAVGGDDDEVVAVPVRGWSRRQGLVFINDDGEGNARHAAPATAGQPPRSRRPKRGRASVLDQVVAQSRNQRRRTGPGPPTAGAPSEASRGPASSRGEAAPAPTAPPARRTGIGRFFGAAVTSVYGTATAKAGAASVATGTTVRRRRRR